MAWFDASNSSGLLCISVQPLVNVPEGEIGSDIIGIVRADSFPGFLCAFVSSVRSHCAFPTSRSAGHWKRLTVQL
jgi:hypothetical protein